MQDPIIVNIPRAKTNLDQRGAALLLSALLIGTIVIVIALAIETALVLTAKNQLQAYAQYAAEGALREFILSRNQTGVNPVTQSTLAQSRGIDYADSEINALIFQRGGIAVTRWEWGRWNRDMQPQFTPGLNEQSNAVRVSVSAFTMRTVFGRILTGATDDQSYVVRCMAVHDERLLTDRLYPYQVIRE